MGEERRHERQCDPGPRRLGERRPQRERQECARQRDRQHLRQCRPATRAATQQRQGHDFDKKAQQDQIRHAPRGEEFGHHVATTRLAVALAHAAIGAHA